jgi:hypothetical protein
MRILTIFHLLTNLEKNHTKVQAMDGASVVCSLPPPPNKGQLGIASFPSLKVNSFQATLLLYFAPRLWTR